MTDMEAPNDPVAELRKLMAEAVELQKTLPAALEDPQQFIKKMERLQTETFLLAPALLAIFDKQMDDGK